jgi:hypothetical protein
MNQEVMRFAGWFWNLEARTAMAARLEMAARLVVPARGVLPAPQHEPA